MLHPLPLSLALLALSSPTAPNAGGWSTAVFDTQDGYTLTVSRLHRTTRMSLATGDPKEDVVCQDISSTPQDIGSNLQTASVRAEVGAGFGTVRPYIPPAWSAEGGGGTCAYGITNMPGTVRVTLGSRGRMYGRDMDLSPATATALADFIQAP